MLQSEHKQIALENKRLIEEEFKKRTYLKLYSEILEHFLDSDEQEQRSNLALIQELQQKLAN